MAASIGKVLDIVVRLSMVTDTVTSVTVRLALLLTIKGLKEGPSEGTLGLI